MDLWSSLYIWFFFPKMFLILLVITIDRGIHRSDLIFQWSAWTSNIILWCHTSGKENFTETRDRKNGAVFYWPAQSTGPQHSGLFLIAYFKHENMVYLTNVAETFVMFSLINFIGSLVHKGHVIWSLRWFHFIKYKKLEVWKSLEKLLKETLVFSIVYYNWSSCLWILFQGWFMSNFLLT
jgi:hypothetical protein